jgi:serine/threonine-protein kinase
MPMPLAPIPRRLGRYEVLDRLAVGGMAEVFVCSERGVGGLERLVVIKRILPHLSVHEAFVEMFLAEARYVARLSHPNVVQIIELAQDEQGAPFLVMEYVPGKSVRDLLIAAIDRETPTPIGAAVGIVVQACAGAHAAHELLDPSGRPLGLVHRDISPHNLMVTSEGHIKLLDFGIAKATQAALLDEQTRTGALKGKIHYMSPEQCKQQALDRRSDVFALAIVLWESLAQERLFKRASDLDSIHAIIDGERLDLRAIRSDVPEALVRIIEKALAARKEDRHASADEMRRALLAVCADLRISCTIDDVALFVRPLLGEAVEQRRVDLLQQARDRTQVMAGEEATIVPASEIRTAETEPKSRGHSPTTPMRPSHDTPAPTVPKKERAPARTIFTALFLVLVVGSTLGAALAITEHLSPSKGTAMSMAFPPTADAAFMLEDTEPLRRWLEKALDRPVSVAIASSYGDLQARLLNGEFEVAALPPYLYVETKQKEPRLELIATKLVEGSSGNDSILYVSDVSNISEIAQLKGKRFCFPDSKSTTGYLFPRLAFKKAGLDPDKDIVPHLSGSHMQAMRDLLNGVCEAAATYSGGFLAADRAGVPVARAHQLAIIGRSPHDAMVVRVGMAAKERDRIREALLSFKPVDGGKAGRVERISGFKRGDNRDYDAVREALSK